jgi:hypothetical protein
MGPLTYQRLKRKYGWFSEESYMKAKKKKRDIFGLDFFARNQDDDDDIFDTSEGKGDKMIKMQKFTTENPVLRAISSDPSRMSTESEASSTRIRPLRNKMFAERRREHRMNDQDLVFHAYRINLLGSNHPLQYKGAILNCNTLIGNLLAMPSSLITILFFCCTQAGPGVCRSADRRACARC